MDAAVIFFYVFVFFSLVYLFFIVKNIYTLKKIPKNIRKLKKQKYSYITANIIIATIMFFICVGASMFMRYIAYY